MDDAFYLEDLRGNFIERYSDLEEFDLFWEVRDELKESLCQRVIYRDW